MSSRLIILPKKSYCPWNPKNVERVERDEREHREAQERSKRQQAQGVAHQRSKALRQRGVQEDGSEKRFNLFEEEERKHMQRQQEELLRGGGGQALKTGSGRNASPASPSKGYFASCQPDATPFYVTMGSTKKETSSLFLNNRQSKRKRELDPMKHFHLQDHGDDIMKLPSAVAPRTGDVKSMNSNTMEEKNSHKRPRHAGEEEGTFERKRRHKPGEDESPISSSSSESSSSCDKRRHKRRRREKRKRRVREEKKKKKKKHSSRHRDSRSRDKKHKSRYSKRDHDVAEKPASSDSMEALRERRAEREQAERQRSRELLGHQSSNSRRYQDQYHPHLSNR